MDLNDSKQYIQKELNKAANSKSSDHGPKMHENPKQYGSISHQESQQPLLDNEVVKITKIKLVRAMPGLRTPTYTATGVENDFISS